MTTVTDGPKTEANLKKAVHHHRLASKRGLLERLFTLWFRGFVYNQIWEDPRVDAEALNIGPHSSLLTISSGGCNVLNYLVHKPSCDDIIITTYSDTILVILTQVEVSREPCLVDENGRTHI